MTLVLALSGPKLEAHVEASARAKRTPQAYQAGRQFGGGDVEQAGAAPDAVVGVDLGDIPKGSNADIEAAVLAGKRGQFGRGVEGADLEATIGDGLRVSPRAAACVQDVRVHRKPGQEGFVQP